MLGILWRPFPWLFLSFATLLAGCAVQRVESVGVANLNPRSVGESKALLYGMIIVPNSVGNNFSLRLEKSEDENDSFFISFNDSTEVPFSGENYSMGLFAIALPEGKYRYFSISSGGGHIARWSFPYPLDYFDVQAGKVYYFGTFQCMQMGYECGWYNLEGLRSKADAYANKLNPYIEWNSAENLRLGNSGYMELLRDELTKKN